MRGLGHPGTVTTIRRAFLTAASACLALWVGRVAVADEPSMTIVALGDSTTAGTPAFRSPVESPPEGRGNPESQYTYWMMQRHPEWRVLNRGVNGERTDQLLRRFARDVTAHHARVVILLAGVNDLYQGSPAERVISQLQRLYDRAAQEHLTIVACTILPYAGIDAARRERLTRVNAWIRDTSASRGWVFCDLFTAAQDSAAPWTLKGSPDGLHPGVAGYRAMGEALADVIERWLASSPGP